MQRSHLIGYIWLSLPALTNHKRRFFFFFFARVVNALLQHRKELDEPFWTAGNEFPGEEVK